MPKSVKQLEWTPEQSKKFWDYESQFPQNYFTYKFGATIIRRLKKYLGGAATVLDYGCGMGNLIPHLLLRGFQVTGADFSPQSMAAVRAQFGSHPGFRGAFCPDELSGRFEAIIVVEVIEHLPDAALNEAMATIRNHAAPAAKVIFTAPNGEDIAASSIFCAGCERVFHRWQHVRSWSQESLRAYLASAGFTVIEIFTTDFAVSFPRNKLGSLRFALKKLFNKEFPHLVCIAQAS